MYSRLSILLIRSSLPQNQIPVDADFLLNTHRLIQDTRTGLLTCEELYLRLILAAIIVRYRIALTTRAKNLTKT
jgi:hypothetical protein